MKDGIAVVGTILVDKLNEIAAYPKVGELTKISRVKKSVGGCVPNVAVDLKRICPELTVKAVGKIGNDDDGEFVKNVLRKDGVDVEYVGKTGGKTSFTEVMSVVGGQRTFFTYAGANADLGADDVPLSALNVKILHLGYLLLLDKIDGGEGEKLLKRAQESAIKTSIDFVSENSDRYASVLPCLRYTDNLIINEIEAGRLTGIEPNKANMMSICKKLQSFGVCERVIVHCPEYGACLNGDVYTVVPSYELSDEFIRGTTGAGDAFCAGALYAIYAGLSDKELLEFASAAAVAALSEVDATSGMKSKSEIERFCEKLDRRNIC